MRIGLGTAVMALSLAAAVVAQAADVPAEGQPGFSMTDFKLVTAQDLYDVCTVEPSDPNQAVAEAFCYGFFSGGKHYHDEVATVDNVGPLFCPPKPLTRQEMVAVFVDFMNRNPGRGSGRPIDVIFEAGGERFPCPAAQTAQ
jgi:hypothetical protein